MPFGAERQGQRGIRFRLWAPGASAVKLRVEDEHPAMELDMAPEEEGWFGIVTAVAAPGSRYRFRVDEGEPVPDPASRFQPEDVHGPSEVIEPREYEWSETDWGGRPWHEAVIYELHVGTFTPEGTFAAAAERLEHLAWLGVTAIELMPVADFAGQRNWGYDGVLPFAPDSTYGRPEDLKHLVDAAHGHGLMVLLDVVYNHFGPEGNYLPRIAPQFFTRRHETRWGSAINYDGPGSDTVRAFVVANAHYWLNEYNLDGLRLDAIDTIADERRPDIVEELAEAVRTTTPEGRHVHLVVENDRNEARYLERDAVGRPRSYDAQWNDDFHHAAHVLATGEDDGYYVDYQEAPAALLARCLAEGFGYQGEVSAWRDERPRGTASKHLPPTAFVNFLQNHDQVGNRAFGERLTALTQPEAATALTAILLLAPQPPLLFMGQEWASTRPFLFFCDFEADLKERVAAGRRDEFAGFRAFRDPATRDRIPDPGDAETFRRSVLDWDETARSPQADWLAHCRHLLTIRRREIVPRIASGSSHAGQFRTFAARGIEVTWSLEGGEMLQLLANLGPNAATVPAEPNGRLVHGAAPEAGVLEPWAVAWYLSGTAGAGTGRS
jgi:malto-oligosyltrehalose trehalohydrolase